MDIVNKPLQLFVILALLVSIVVIPTQVAHAATCTGGQSCWYKDAAATTRTYNGTTKYCSNGAITAVYSSGLAVNGTSGQVNDELRWSSWCTANWTRGTIYVANQYTYQLGLKASPTNSGYYATKYYYGVGAGYQNYTWMVDGSSTVWSYSGIGPSRCDGDTDSHGNYTGFSSTCTPQYNPMASYSG
jgi:hypothetical protein